MRERSGVSVAIVLSWVLEPDPFQKPIGQMGSQGWRSEMEFWNSPRAVTVSHVSRAGPVQSWVQSAGENRDSHKSSWR